MDQLAFKSFAIVPAAGRSRRMGQPKLLLHWQNSTIIEHVLTAWQTSCVDQIIVVTHPEDDALRSICRRPGVTVLSANPPPEDMRSSIMRGVDHIRLTFSPQPGDAWLIAPADMPLLSHLAIDALLTAHVPSRPSILQPVLADGDTGHPVLFPWELAREVANLPPDVGVNELLRRHDSKLIACPAAPAAPDIDTPQDFDRLHNRYGRID